MGKAKNWQQYVVQKLSPQTTILNPRRDDWDNSRVQDIKNKQFREQVEWELHAQEDADLILMHFEPGTQSPITLLEFRLFADSSKLVVHCPEGFWRKGNVDIVCSYCSICSVKTLDEMVSKTVHFLNLFNNH